MYKTSLNLYQFFFFLESCTVTPIFITILSLSWKRQWNWQIFRVDIRWISCNNQQGDNCCRCCPILPTRYRCFCHCCKYPITLCFHAPETQGCLSKVRGRSGREDKVSFGKQHRGRSSHIAAALMHCSSHNAFGHLCFVIKTNYRPVGFGCTLCSRLFGNRYPVGAYCCSEATHTLVCLV